MFKKRVGLLFPHSCICNVGIFLPAWMATNPRISIVHMYRHYLESSPRQLVTKQGTVGLEECIAIVIFPLPLQRPTLRVASLQLLQYMPIHVISLLPTNLWLSTEAVVWCGQWSRLMVQVKQSLYRLSQALTVPGSWGSQMKVVRLSALPTGRLFPPGYIPVSHFS